MRKPGEFADTAVARKPILRIAAITVLHAEVILLAEAYAFGKSGQKVTIGASVSAKLSTQGVLKVVDKVFDVASGTLGLRLGLANPGLNIPVGIHCEAEFAEVQLSASANRKPLPQARLSP